jgi:hypothetical protein
LESASEEDREIYMVGQGEQPAEKITEENTRETEQVLAHVARLEAATAGKKHND